MDEVLEYRARYERSLRTCASGLEALTRGHLEGVSNIDRVTSRAKDPDRFAEKAARLGEDGTRKYEHPLEELQDQIGLRVIVFYLSDVDVVFDVLTQYFRAIEHTELVPESDWEFGYFGRHAVFALPADVVPSDVDVRDVPRFFEVQVKTLFQHAWSEANHDLGYKSPTPLTGDQQRRLAYAAAQSWGSDRAFEELRVDLMRTDP